MTQLKAGDRVVASYRGSKFVGTITHLWEKNQEADVRFAPGVAMLLPLRDIELLNWKEEDDE